MLPATRPQSSTPTAGGVRVGAMVAAIALMVPPCFGQMVTRDRMPGFREVFRLEGSTLNVRQIGASTGPNVVWPGESIEVRFEIENRTDRAVSTQLAVETIGFGTSVPFGDIWVPHVKGPKSTDRVSIGAVEIPAGRRVVLSASPRIPERFGGYGLVLDAGPHGRYFLGSTARVVEAEPGRVFEPAYAIDMPWPHEMSAEVARTFSKLGVKGCRMGVGFTTTREPRFSQYLRQLEEHLRWCHENEVTVMLTIGEGGAPMPLNRGRPWLRDDHTMIEGAKEDLCWLPAYDEDFREWVRRICLLFGWPKGPVNAVELWNEPWEGVSISGWGADLPRYRELYRQMAAGVLDARRENVEVLIGGCSSSSNTRDKLFPDGSLEFLPILDFVSIHYEGLGASPGLDPLWMNRTGKFGRVRVWDTESWVANSEDRIPGVVASMRSFGQDRAMGTYGGNIYTSQKGESEGKEFAVVQAWPPAAGVAAAAKFIGQREFDRLLFPLGLPWVYVFRGQKSPDDGTLVLQGDLTALYEPEYVLFRDVQLALRAKPATIEFRAQPQFRVHDSVGNLIPPERSVYRLPIGSEGYYLRTDGSPGSIGRLVEAVRNARIEGLQPVSLEARDFLDDNKRLRVAVTNVLNRTVRGSLTVTLGGVSRSTSIQIPPNSVRETSFDFSPVSEAPTNLYPAVVVFDAGRDGRAELRETFRVNQIARRSIQVDGDLGDWSGVLPQTVTAESLARTLADAAWRPFQENLQARGTGAAEAYLAEDDQGFYFAAKIFDPTPHDGLVRFETRDDDSYYYPSVSYSTSKSREFSARFGGNAVAPVAGRYQWVLVSDDGARLWLNDRLVLDEWRDRAETENVVETELRAGERVQIRMEYFQSGGQASARLHWIRPDGIREPVPLETGRAEFFHGRDLASPMGSRPVDKIDFELGPDFPGLPDDGRVRHTWPADVRRFSYRRDPDLPSGNGEDNVQIAFNVLPNDRKPLKMAPAGVMPRYMVYPCTDYEFALNAVAPRFGGGTEVFRLSAPGVPRKHFYPRQPSAPVDGGPVRQAKLVVKREGQYRIVEAFIPWSELEEVRKARDAGRTVKFSFRVNDSNGPSYELAQDRSCSKGNNWAFHNDWVRHWANEIEFSFERSRR